MKKIKLYLMIGMMAVGLAGCGQTGSQPEGQSGGQAEEQTGSRTEGQTGSQSEDQSGDGTEGQTGSQSQDRTGGQADSQPEGQGESQAGQPDAGADAAYTFTDDLGREVTVESYERVATLLGSYADMWILAGGGCLRSAGRRFRGFRPAPWGGYREPGRDQAPQPGTSAFRRP